MAQMEKVPIEFETRREKKKGGFFARLFGGGSTGGVAGVGGAGGVGAGGGMFGGLGGLGGLLATKAGLTLAVMIGTVVVGFLGLVAYHLFSPGSDQANGDNLSLFAPRPKEDGSPAVTPVAKDGSSDSLRFLAQANAVPGSPELNQTAAPTDETAASATGAAPAAASDAGGHAGDLATGNGVNKNLLKNVGKFGELTKTAGTGGPAVSGGRGSSASAANSVAAEGAGAVASAHAGLSTGMKKGLMVAGGSSRGIAGQRGAGGALRQALGALTDNRSAQTSYAAGHTYDGSTGAGGSNIGPDGGLIGSGGPGAATGAPQPTSLPNSAATPNDPQAPPTPTSTDAAPWQNAIKTAQALIGVAVLLLLAANLLAKEPHGKIIVQIIAAIVASMGAMVIALGAQIASGQWGQKLQGGVLAAAGTGLIVAAAAAAFGGGNKGGANSSGMNVDGSVADESSTASSTASGGTSGSGSGGLLANINPFVLIGGGLGLIGLCGSMMSPPTKYPSKDFQNGNPPDTHWFGYREAPSQAALEKYLV